MGAGVAVGGVYVKKHVKNIEKTPNRLTYEIQSIIFIYVGF